MMPVLAGYIAMSIADRPGLAVGFVGGAIANMGMTFANPAGGVFSAGFLGALLAGFIGGYLVLGLRRLCDLLPQSLEGIKPVLIYPLVGILLIGVIMSAVNPAVGAINDGLTNALNSMGSTSKILLGIVAGGMMSVDMGGPVNKAAYVFGTADETWGYRPVAFIEADYSAEAIARDQEEFGIDPAQSCIRPATCPQEYAHMVHDYLNGCMSKLHHPKHIW